MTYTNADSRGKYKGHQSYANGLNGNGISGSNAYAKQRSDSSSGFSRGFTLKQSNYLGSEVDINLYREHCMYTTEKHTW